MWLLSGRRWELFWDLGGVLGILHKNHREEILQGFQDDPFRRVSLVTNDPRLPAGEGRDLELAV